MTWSAAESARIDDMLKSIETTAENVREIKEAIVGSLLNGGKPGLQDTVREMGTDIGINRDRLNAHKKVVGRDHRFMKMAILGVGVFALVGLLVNLEEAGHLLGSLIVLLIKIFT